MPIERGFLTIIEKAIGEDIKLEEIGQLFPDDSSAKQSLMQQQSRQDMLTQGQEVKLACGKEALAQSLKMIHSCRVGFWTAQQEETRWRWTWRIRFVENDRRHFTIQKGF